MAARLRLALTLGLLLASVSAARAQIGLYAMGSVGFLGSANIAGAQADQNKSFSAFGGTFGIYDQMVKLGPMKFGADGRFFAQSGNNGGVGNKMHGGFGGLRLALQTGLFPVKPYIQAEVGGVSTNYGVETSNSTSFAYQVQGGLDFTLVPHLDARAEYGGGQINSVYSGQRQTLQQVGFGLVVRF